MAHTVLARKWRPKKFADLVGQQQTRTILQNILLSQRLHHAYLLTGTRGVGKTTIARIIAKALNCLEPLASEPCGVCSNCQSIDMGRFVDVIEIDAASNTGVDNVRELIEDAKYAPSLGKYKIYIIDEVHMLSKSAFNAMLKTLEEPPLHAIFILATTDPQKVPITILSRCLQLKLRNLLATEIEGHLKYVLHAEQVIFDDGAITLLARAAHGSMRDALSLLDQAIAFSPNNIKTAIVTEMLGLSDNEKIHAIFTALINSNSVDLINLAKSCQENGEDFASILDNIRQKLCNISIAQLSGIILEPSSEEYGKKISTTDTHLYFEIANLGLQQLERATDKYSVFVMTLLRMLAFRIGSHNEKQLTINATNFNSKTTATVSTLDIPITTPSTQLDTQSIMVEEVIASPEMLTQTPPIVMENSISTKTFTGDWFHLITELKPELGYLYPVLENAQLQSHANYIFTIIIDTRYESIMNNEAINRVVTIFNHYFNTNTTLNFSFAAKVNNTLKEKHTTAALHKQDLAENAIKDDAHLNQILSDFSATILPGSIKPL